MKAMLRTASASKYGNCCLKMWNTLWLWRKAAVIIMKKIMCAEVLNFPWIIKAEDEYNLVDAKREKGKKEL